MALLSVHYFITILSMFIGCFFIAYLWLKKKFSYWDKLGVRSLNPNFFFGNYKDHILMRAPESTLIERVYREFESDKCVGLYFMWKPMLLIKDPEWCKRIFVKDFGFFRNRPQICDLNDTDAVMKSIFFDTDERWKNKRAALLHIYNNTSFKAMKPKVEEACDEIMSHLEALAITNEDIRMENFIFGIAANVAFSIILGLKINNSKEILKALERLTFPGTWTLIKKLIYRVLPNVHRQIFKTVFDKNVWEFLSKFVEEIQSLDNKESFHGSDLLTLRIKYENDKIKGYEAEDDIVGTLCNTIKSFLSPGGMVCLVLHELSKNMDIQTRLRKEIKQLEKNNEQYDNTLKSNTLMNNVLKETFRIYPPVAILRRVSNDDCKIDENLTIPKDTEVLIPVKAFHYDSQYFENPHVFNPDRFKESTSWMWLPFGQGPRQCLGISFVAIEMKTMLSAVLTRFEILPSTKMELPIKYKIPANLGAEVPSNAFWMKLRLVNESSENSN